MKNKTTSVIILPGLFENASSGFLNNIHTSLASNGYEVTVLEYFSSFTYNSAGSKLLSVITFNELINDLRKRIQKITQNNQKITIVGHSLGAYIGLTNIANVDKIICFDISSHPREIFKHMIIDKGICNWPNMEEMVQESFVRSADSLPKVGDLLKSIKSRIYFIGASKGGSNISQEYHSYVPHLSEYIECLTDHNFTGYEEWAAGVILNILKNHN